MPALLFFIFTSQASALILLYIADRGLKLASKSRAKQVEMFALTAKHKYLYVYYRRKDGIITKYAFMCMIAYYIINVTGCIVLFAQYIMDNSSFPTPICVILIFANTILFIPSGSQPTLSFEQRGIYIRYIKDERAKRKKEKG